MTDCPICDSTYANFMGRLGALYYFRCRYCGMEFSMVDGDTDEYYEDDY